MAVFHRRCARHAGPRLLQHRQRRTNLSGGAKAALKAIVLDECGLHRVKLFSRGQPFNRRDALSLLRNRQRETRQNTRVIRQHRAGAALAVVAALLGPHQMQTLAQQIQQRDAGFQM